MIKFSSMRQYTHVVDGIMFPLDIKRPYVIFYFSENSTFLEDYPYLKLRKLDFRTVVVPISKIPRTVLKSELRNAYRRLKLMVFPINQKIPTGRNIIVDMTPFLKNLDAMFRPINYRTRAGFLILAMLNTVLKVFPNNYQKVFMYSVDKNKEFPEFINRKIFPILREIKEENLFIDNLLLTTIQHGEARFRLLIKNGQYKFQRLWYMLRNIKGEISEDEIDSEIEKATNNIVEPFEADLVNKEKVKASVTNYLKNKPDELEKFVQPDETYKTEKPLKDKEENIEKAKIITKSVLYGVSGNLKKSDAIVRAIPKNKLQKALKKVDKKLAKEIVEKPQIKPTTNDVAILAYNPVKLVDNKVPTHLFRKRQLDFSENLHNDIINSFKVLESKDIPIYFKSMQFIPKQTTTTEIEKSETGILKIKLVDKFNNEHDVEIELPIIDPHTGTFMLGGIRHCLINQIILCPITFPSPGESRFESSYSKFRISSVFMRKRKFLESFMICRSPLIFLLSFLFGFEETLKYYEIGYEIVEKKVKTEYIVKIGDNRYIVFHNVDTELKKQLINGFLNENFLQYKIEEPFGSRKFFEKYFIKKSGRISTPYNINNVKENVIDPIVKQILINMQLPFELPSIMKYMAQKTVEGFVIERNDIRNQRIRNSEVLVHLIQKQILAAYTVYREQVLSGNVKAKLNIKPQEVLSQFRRLELSVVMEYANPIEEMSTMTRITPVGKGIGGIPDKRAINTEGRNIHPSYFGNIDPLDTPEGENIGIVQQLAIDSFIASTRGLFQQKPISDKEHAGMLSVTLSLTPFIENNDGARVIMIANQAKQMLPLKNPQPPPIQTGYESILTNYLSDYFIKKAPCSGEVTKITNDFIYIKCGNKTVSINIMPSHLRSGSGKNTLSVFRPLVSVGTKVTQNQIIAEGACLADGIISTGKPLLCAFMPYMGYNFEDGVIISDRLVNQDVLTSLHAIEETVYVEENDRLLYINEIGAWTEKGDPLLRKIPGMIEQLVGTSEEENEEIIAGQYIKKSPGGRIVDIEVFSNLPIDKFPKLRPYIERTNIRYKKSGREAYRLKGELIKGILIRFKIEQELKIGEGDKICNRHGNKGIITRVLEHEQMPRLPNGQHVDIILNPIGLVGRMNPGQLFELYCGLISRELAIRILQLKDRKKIVDLIVKVYEKLDTSPDRKHTALLQAGLNSLSDRAFMQMLQKVNKSGFYPLLIPPFKAPNYAKIRDALAVLNLREGYKLYLPELKTYTMREVPVGYLYISKLEHLGDAKLYSRSIGPVTGKTNQPTAGKRREGGQKVGELDTYSFISYDCPAVLAELMGPLSDDYVTKEEMLAEIINTGKTTYRPAKVTPAKDLLNVYFIALMLEKK